MNLEPSEKRVITRQSPLWDDGIPLLAGDPSEVVVRRSSRAFDELYDMSSRVSEMQRAGLGPLLVRARLNYSRYYAKTIRISNRRYRQKL